DLSTCGAEHAAKFASAPPDTPPKPPQEVGVGGRPHPLPAKEPRGFFPRPPPASTNGGAMITLPWHIVDARLTFPRNNAMPVRDHLMKFDITSFQAVAANLAVEGEVCDLAHAKRSTPTETDPEIAPLIEKVGATSIAEIDRLIAE